MGIGSYSDKMDGCVYDINSLCGRGTVSLVVKELTHVEPCALWYA